MNAIDFEVHGQQPVAACSYCRLTSAWRAAGAALRAGVHAGAAVRRAGCATGRVAAPRAVDVGACRYDCMYPPTCAKAPGGRACLQPVASCGQGGSGNAPLSNFVAEQDPCCWTYSSSCCAVAQQPGSSAHGKRFCTAGGSATCVCRSQHVAALPRAWLASAGPAFIKWGQWAATRPDMFPGDLCDALAVLQVRTQVNNLPSCHQHAQP